MKSTNNVFLVLKTFSNFLALITRGHWGFRFYGLVIFEIGFSAFHSKCPVFYPLWFSAFSFLNVRFSVFIEKEKGFFVFFFLQLHFLVSRPFWFTWRGAIQVTFPVKVAHKRR